MEDVLELTNIEHPDAQQAATATARLLIAVHEQRSRPASIGEDQRLREGEDPTGEREATRPGS